MSTFSLIFELAVSFFDSALCVFFISKYLKYGFKPLPEAIAVILLYGITLLNDFGNEELVWVFTGLLYIATLGYALFICKKKYLDAVLSACIFHLSLIILSTLLMLCFRLLVDDFEVLAAGANNSTRYTMVIIHKILLFATLRFILAVRKSTENGKLANGILTFIFSLITAVGLGIAIVISSLVDSNRVIVLLIALSLVFLILNVFFYVMLSQIFRLQNKNFELELLNEKTRTEEDKYQEVLAVWNEAQIQRHDIKSHMAAIKGLAEDGRTEECAAYVDSYLNQMQMNRVFPPSGNQVIDYLIQAKLSGLSDTQIIVVGNVGSLSDIADVDLASLIGNILDNAVEAEEKVSEKRIELLFQYQNQNRIIICRNHVDQSVLHNNKELASTKQHPGRHGYGHRIVAEIVQKYNGLIHYFEEEDMFGVEILLPEKNTLDK